MNDAETTRADCECEHEFTLILDSAEALDDDAVNALYEAGCDDATISTRHGRGFITFARTAPSLKHAILSAIRNIRDARIRAVVLRVDDCDLVNQAEIARRITCTRSLVNQYISGERGPGRFPAAACNLTDGNPLWSWCDVSTWLFQNDMVKANVMRDAQDVSMINFILGYSHFRQADSITFEAIASEILSA